MNNRLLNLKNGISTLPLLVMGLFLFSNCGGSDDTTTTGTTPAVSSIVITGSITVFDATNELSSSTPKSVQVNGANLTSDLAISASANFEVSLDDTIFTDDVLIDQASAIAGNTTVYIRFSPMSGAIGNQTGTISFVSAPASTRTLNVNGTGISITPIINTDVVTLAFDDTQMNTQSMTLPIVVNGDNLISDINLVSTVNFEISLDNVAFSTTATIPAATANVDTTIYARFLPTAVSNYTGNITLQNTDTPDVVIALSGNGTPVINNYTAFQDLNITISNQTETAFFNLQNDISNVETIKMYVKLRCPAAGCNAWDVYANIKVRDVASGDWYEIGRYITPYGIDNSAVARGFEIDVTDFKSLLSGNVELYARIETWGSDGWELSVDFDYIEGTPDYPFYAVSEVLGYNAWSTSGVPYGGTLDTNVWDLTKDVTIPANADETSLRTIISGWGHATPTDSDGRPCAEWCYRTHDVKIDGTNMFQHDMGPIGCASNPVSGQAGNWTPDRAGWCPGMDVPVRTDVFATPMSGASFAFEYDYENWTTDGGNTSGQGGAYYATSTYVVVKSNTPIVKPTVN